MSRRGRRTPPCRVADRSAWRSGESFASNLALAGVEGARGFIEREDLRVRRQDGGDRDFLSLADAHMIRGERLASLHADLFQRALHAITHLGLRTSEIHRSERYIFKNSGHEQLIMRLLKDQADRPPHFV